MTKNYSIFLFHLHSYNVAELKTTNEKKPSFYYKKNYLQYEFIVLSQILSSELLYDLKIRKVTVNLVRVYTQTCCK
jgi:hypothetical protein